LELKSIILKKWEVLLFVNNKIKVNNFRVINTNISDHLPLVLDFDILD